MKQTIAEITYIPMNYQKFTWHALDYFHIFHLFISCLLSLIKIFLNQFALVCLFGCYFVLLLMSVAICCEKTRHQNIRRETVREAYTKITEDGDDGGGRGRELCDQISPKQLRWFLFSSTEKRVCLPPKINDQKKTRE